jgi:hypothetical protein
MAIAKTAKAIRMRCRLKFKTLSLIGILAKTVPLYSATVST